MVIQILYQTSLSVLGLIKEGDQINLPMHLFVVLMHSFWMSAGDEA